MLSILQNFVSAKAEQHSPLLQRTAPDGEPTGVESKNSETNTSEVQYSVSSKVSAKVNHKNCNGMEDEGVCTYLIHNINK